MTTWHKQSLYVCFKSWSSFALGFILQLVKMLNSFLWFYLFMFLQNFEENTFTATKETKIGTYLHLNRYISNTNKRSCDLCFGNREPLIKFFYKKILWLKATLIPTQRSQIFLLTLWFDEKVYLPNTTYIYRLPSIIRSDRTKTHCWTGGRPCLPFGGI